MQPGASIRRLIYDVGFEACGVRLRAELADPEYIQGSYKGDVWLVKPLLSERDSVSKKQLAAAFSQVARGLIGNKVTPLQDYTVRVSVSMRRVEVLVPPGKGSIKSIRQGLAASPGWDGHSFDFQGSDRLAYLIADIKEGVLLGAEPVRSNGEPIVGFERFIM